MIATPTNDEGATTEVRSATDFQSTGFSLLRLRSVPESTPNTKVNKLAALASFAPSCRINQRRHEDSSAAYADHTG
ncbi:MAG: hypothetical protein JOZ19_10725 [Rubrobacter sp.]|nr:hypothetical protein [Rubrobacter sp.]